MPLVILLKMNVVLILANIISQALSTNYSISRRPFDLATVGGSNYSIGFISTGSCAVRPRNVNSHKRSRPSAAPETPHHDLTRVITSAEKNVLDLIRAWAQHPVFLVPTSFEDPLFVFEHVTILHHSLLDTWTARYAIPNETTQRNPFLGSLPGPLSLVFLSSLRSGGSWIDRETDGGCQRLIHRLREALRPLLSDLSRPLRPW